MSNTIKAWLNVGLGVAIFAALLFSIDGHIDDRRNPAAWMIRSCKGVVQMTSAVNGEARVTTVTCTEKQL
jgi:hypothetical protein